MSRRFATAVTAVVTTVILTSVAAGGAAAPGKQLPVDVTPPTISGTATVGSGMTAAPGTWSGKGLRYSNQWLRCDSTGASCGAITGASNWTYGLSAAASGATFRVIVTATNRNGSTAATSAATAVVSSGSSASGGTDPPPLAPAPTSPSNTSLPAISGTAQQGVTLNAETGSWSGTTPMAYAYQWQRCDSGGTSCAAVSGATGSSYALASGDVGSTMRVSVTATNSAGSATASSSATPVVSAVSSPGTVLYGKTFEQGTNLNGSSSLEQSCYPAQPTAKGTPVWPFIPDFCSWYQVLQYGYQGCQFITNTTDNFAGSGILSNNINNADPARCEMEKYRRVDAYTTDYYHFAFKLSPNWTESSTAGVAIGQFDYQSIDAAPLLFNIDAQTNSGYLLVNSGSCGNRSISATGCGYFSGQPSGGGYAPRPAGMPGPLYVIPPGKLTRNQWIEVVFQVYWTPTNGGSVAGWFRYKGDANWTKTLDVGPAQYAFPTLQTGYDGQEDVTVDNINDPSHWPPIDKFGQYGSNVSNGTIYFDNWCRATSFSAAASCVGS